MRAFPRRRWLPTASRLALVGAFILASAVGAFAQADATSANLSGYVRDPQGAVVTGATVRARNAATSVERETTTNDEGFYQLTNLPPGAYEVSVEASNFKKAVLTDVTVTVGQRADLDIALEIGALTDVVTITGASTELVETTRTNVSNTIDEQRIDNLPINQRDYINFTLTTSTVTRDNGRPIGPAPTSGLNFGGQRGRSNLVQVDGADNTDNSVNAARSTVSQEAVQEFQVVTNSFAPEFGRTAGGVVNVVTKGGTNEVRGNVFGFIRHKSIQAKNAFAPIIDNDPDKKPPFTRAQYGFTIGGPLAKDRTFGFFAFEQRKRQESGFFTSDVFGSGSQRLDRQVTIPAIPGLNPAARTFGNLSPDQVTYINALLATGTPAGICGARAYAFLASSGGATGLTGSNPLSSPNDGSGCPAFSPIIPSAAAPIIGSRFLLSGAPVPVSQNAFRPLTQLARVFPISEDTTFASVRGDHRINDAHNLTMRFGYNPSDITGIQVESQNQSLGQNDFSRTGIQTLRDTSFVTTLNSTLSNTVVNEARFNFGQRRATFTSQNGQATAYNISGVAFIGRELFSPVVRTEKRYQYTDTINWVYNNHTFKFGGDANFISVDAVFELNFAGLFNFGGLSAGTLNSAFVRLPTCGANEVSLTCAPGFTPVQQYGLGFPGNFIQGFGNPVSNLKNRPFALFAQDSWKINNRFTVNYGVRYDYEHTQQLAVQDFRDPLSGLTVTAATTQQFYDAFNIQQGFPRDKNNFAPRLGVAWDLKGDGNTVLRAAAGIFYDHPLLAIGFNSDIADNVQQQQFIALPGQPGFINTGTGQPELLNAVQIFQGTVCNGVTGANPLCPAGFRTPGVAAGTDYQFGRQRFNDQTFPGFGPFLPFSLPVATDFEYAYANQANVTLERKLTENMSFSASWLFVGAHHLPHPTNLNAPNNTALIENFRRCTGVLPTSTTAVLTLNPSTCSNIAATVIPNLLVVTSRGAVVQPFVANLFRPSGPNYLFTQAVSGGAVTPAVLNGALTATGALARPGFVTTFGDINAQVSDGNSVYHAGTFEVKRRFANNFQFLGSYTWSHSIDDSSDLQTLLLPQDVTRLDLERADSLFDQRHRFVFSGVLAAPGEWRGAGGFRSFLADFVVAPIFEISSGRPFNILTGQDTNNDLSSSTDRPSVTSDGTLFVPQPFQSGSLGRNAGLTHSYSSLDLRVTRNIRFGERLRLEVIAEGFNLFNRFNEAAVSPRFEDVNATGERAGNGRYRSRSTAAFDPRQFQFGLKLNF